jgi:hypothetical protein
VPAGRRDHVDAVADVDVVVVRRVPVDRHLIRTCRRFAIEQTDRVVGIAAVPRGAEHRRPAGGDGVAVAVDDLGASLQDAVGVGDPRDGGDGVDELGRDGVARDRRVVVVAEGERRADLKVGLGKCVGEQRVEARTHAVGEHERADDERHAEDDGDGDGDQPADAGAHATARQQEGCVRAHVSR